MRLFRRRRFDQGRPAGRKNSSPESDPSDGAAARRGSPPSSAPGNLAFQCNICGAFCQFPLDQLGRETISCGRCQSTPRKRALVRILLQELLREELPLTDIPPTPNVKGLGLTDADDYAVRLAAKFTYENTYLHKPPLLDISAEIAPERLGQYDFVISSEVFEHVVPPVARAFENVSRLLKPGGLFILTVPFGAARETVEHFPDLYDFTIAEVDGKHVLTNVTRTGETQTFDRLSFHGGPGTTLEMRLFSEPDIRKHLAAAGFAAITTHREPFFRYGIWWPQPWSLPISARKV